MSKEECIAIAEKLKNEFGTIERLQKELNENEKALKTPLTLSDKRYSSFRFFWPFMIYAYIILSVILITGMIISTKLDSKPGIAISFAASFGVAAGLLIFAWIRAKRKSKSLNEKLVEEENQIRLRFQERERRTEKLKIMIADKKSAVSEYQELVPIRFRTKHHMEKVIYLLKTDGAASFDEAIGTLKTKR